MLAPLEPVGDAEGVLDCSFARSKLRDVQLDGDLEAATNRTERAFLYTGLGTGPVLHRQPEKR